MSIFKKIKKENSNEIETIFTLTEHNSNLVKENANLLKELNTQKEITKSKENEIKDLENNMEVLKTTINKINQYCKIHNQSVVAKDILKETKGIKLEI